MMRIKLTSFFRLSIAALGLVLAACSEQPSAPASIDAPEAERIKPEPNTAALPDMPKQKISPATLDKPDELLRIRPIRDKMMANTFSGFVQDVSVAQQYPSQFPDAENPAYRYEPEEHLHTVMAVNVKVIEQYRGAPLEELSYYIARSYDGRRHKESIDDRPYLVHLCQSPDGVYWLTTAETTDYPWKELTAALRKTEAEHAHHTTSDICQ